MSWTPSYIRSSVILAALAVSAHLAVAGPIVLPTPPGPTVAAHGPIVLPTPPGPTVA